MSLTDTGEDTPANKGLENFVKAGEPYRFQPGKSGNPNGRPKKIKEAEDILLEKLKAATEKLGNLVDSEDDRVALQASVQVVERMMGKAVQKVETKDTSDAKQLDEADLVDIATTSGTGTSETKESKTQSH